MLHASPMYQLGEAVRPFIQALVALGTSEERPFLITTIEENRVLSLVA